MISYVNGKLMYIESDKVVVDVNGIGYGVFVPAKMLQALPKFGEEVKLFTYLNVKEDAMQLFGFFSKEDLDIFKLVIGVNGIGPKGGLNILSTLSPDELRFAVLSDDAKTIATTPGIGKKTAEKLIIELKDKMEIKDTIDYISKSVTDSKEETGDRKIQTEAIQALVALGYEQSTSLKVVRKVIAEGDSLTVESLIKLALKNMI